MQLYFTAATSLVPVMSTIDRGTIQCSSLSTFDTAVEYSETTKNGRKLRNIHLVDLGQNVSKLVIFEGNFQLI